jgi:hypothetical protein
MGSCFVVCGLRQAIGVGPLFVDSLQRPIPLRHNPITPMSIARVLPPRVCGTRRASRAEPPSLITADCFLLRSWRRRSVQWPIRNSLFAIPLRQIFRFGFERQNLGHLRRNRGSRRSEVRRQTPIVLRCHFQMCKPRRRLRRIDPGAAGPCLRSTRAGPASPGRSAVWHRTAVILRGRPSEKGSRENASQRRRSLMRCGEKTRGSVPLVSACSTIF